LPESPLPCNLAGVSFLTSADDGNPIRSFAPRELVPWAKKIKTDGLALRKSGNAESFTYGNHRARIRQPSPEPSDPCCNSGETFAPYAFTRPILEDNVKSSAFLAVPGVLGCILIAGCGQTREASVPSPPGTSYEVGSFELQQGASSQNVRGASVTPAFFQTAKMPTLLGRNFIPGDYGSGRQQVAIVSHRLWQERFRGDPRIIGSTMRLNGQAFTVVGIMPRTFDVPSGVDIWVPKAG
jgi:hypothetical protein